MIKEKVRRVLTGSRIDDMKLLYCAISDIFDENQTDELDKDFLFIEVQKRTKGWLNPMLIKQEIEKI